MSEREDKFGKTCYTDEHHILLQKLSPQGGQCPQQLPKRKWEFRKNIFFIEREKKCIWCTRCPCTLKQQSI